VKKKRKAVRGCIIGPDIAVLSLTIVKRGEQDIAGLTDKEVPRRLGPKRVDKIRKMFNLTKKDDVREYIVRRKVTSASGKVHIKKPKIQRLITPTIKHRRKSLEKRVINRRRRSFEKRKQYFEKLAGVQKRVQKKKEEAKKQTTAKKGSPKGPKKSEKKVDTKKQSQKKGSAKKGSAKKGSKKHKKGSGKKGSQKKQPTKQSQPAPAKKPPAKKPAKNPKQ